MGCPSGHRFACRRRLDRTQLGAASRPARAGRSQSRAGGDLGQGAAYSGECPLVEKLPPAVRDIPARRNVALPAAFLKQVTGPELEGMLDLLEQDAPAQPELSI